MTLVLSMNPFLDPEGDPPLSTYRPAWDAERCAASRRSSAPPPPPPPCASAEPPTRESPCRRVPDRVSVSRIAYFKRKFVEDDEPRFSFRTYCQTVAPVLEERAHVLRLSLEKMRFIDDPEAFLRRSVLVNNLLRRLRAEILLQSTDWCFPPNPAFAGGSCAPAPGANPAGQALHGALPARICLAPQAGPPFRKRFRVVRGGQGDLRPDCAQTCCCIYAAAAAAAGHYLHLPFSVYDAALSACPTTPHSSPFFQLAGHSKLGMTVAREEHEDEEEDDEEEEEEEEENDEGEEEEEEEEEEDDRVEAGPSLDVVKDKSSRKSRTKSSLGHTRTKEDTRMAEGGKEGEEGPQEEEEEEEEEGGQEVRPRQSDSKATVKELHKVSSWHRRPQRQ